jgi:hypothetical protein
MVDAALVRKETTASPKAALLNPDFKNAAEYQDNCDWISSRGYRLHRFQDVG